MQLQPGARAGRTIVERPLGSGGMATVYLVRHEELGSTFALKVLDLVTDTLSRRFAAEGRMQASLRHPNVVAVYDVLEVEGRPALLLEYVEGSTLSQWMSEPRSLDEIERIFRQVVAGVQAAHHAGLVHRDLKPANVLLAPGPAGLVAKVADFGVAKEAHTEGATRTGIGMGTPGYMAPEQIRDAKHVDQRADVFALGVMLYEMVCGSRPFMGFGALEIIEAVTKGDYTPPSQVVEGLDPRFEATIRGCLVSSPERRFPSCAAILASLDGEAIGSAAEDTWVQPAAATPRPAGVTQVPATTFSELEPTTAGPGPTMVPPSRSPAGLVALAAGVALVGGIGLTAALWWTSSPPAAEVGAADSPVTPVGLASVVVRPFVVAGGSEDDWIGTALAEDLTFALAGAGGPRVLTQTALDRYERVPAPSQLGEDLGVEAVVEGRVRRTGELIEVRVSIVRTSDDAVVWTQTRTGPIGATTGSNGTVAGAVLTAFDLDAPSPTSSPARLAAQPDFLRGREIVRAYQELRYDEAEDALLRAIEVDPGFVEARTTLARLYLHRGWHGDFADTDTVALAEDQVRLALAQAPDDPRALQVLGRAMVMRGELRGAFQVLNLAIQQGDAPPDAYIDRYEAEVRAGAVDLAGRDLDRAEALDPYYLRVYSNQAWLTTYTGRWEALPAVMERARRRSVDHPQLQRARAESLRRSGQDEALRTHLAAHPDALVQALADRDPVWLTARVEEMAPLGVERPNGVIERARYEAALGRTGDALASLRTALSAYPGYLAHVVDPVFDEVRADPAWPALEAEAREESAALRTVFTKNWLP